MEQFIFMSPNLKHQISHFEGEPQRWSMTFFMCSVDDPNCSYKGKMYLKSEKQNKRMTVRFFVMFYYASEGFKKVSQ